jgi:outer membrane lipoprotein LolB
MRQFKVLLLCSIFFTLTSCSEKIIKPVGDQYNLSERKQLYALKKWAFEGRLAIANENESWTATLKWTHTQDEDKLILSGPLGQTGGILIVSKEAVILDRGEGETLHSTDINGFIEQQLGLKIPVQSLRYWVLGLTHPEHPATMLSDGFNQNNWIIQYAQMQQFNHRWMPRKLKAFQDKTRLKLIIDQWTVQ